MTFSLKQENIFCAVFLVYPKDFKVIEDHIVEHQI